MLRRVMQVGANTADATVTVATLVAAREVQKKRTDIVANLLKVVEDDSDDEREVFVDQKASGDENSGEESDNAASSKNPVQDSAKHSSQKTTSRPL